MSPRTQNSSRSGWPKTKSLAASSTSLKVPTRKWLVTPKSPSTSSSTTTQICPWASQPMTTSWPWWSQPGNALRKKTQKRLRRPFRHCYAKSNPDSSNSPVAIQIYWERSSMISTTIRVGTWLWMKSLLWLLSFRSLWKESLCTRSSKLSTKTTPAELSTKSSKPTFSARTETEDWQ